MIKTILLSFTLTLVATLSVAAADAVPVADSAGGEYAKGIDREDGSTFNRVGKKFTAVYTLVGVGPSNGVSNGPTLGYFIDRDSLIDIEYMSGKPLDIHSYLWTDYEIKTKSFGVHYKRFVSNTFYFRVGADYRQIDYRYTYRDWLSGSLSSENKFTADSIVATIMIGNQWQFENFTLGCDWFGYAQPISSNIKSESSTGTNPDVKELKDDQDRYVKNGIPMGLRFYLGASF